MSHLLDELKRVLEPEAVLEGAAVAERYATDWFRHAVCLPPVVIRPANTEEVSATLRLCHQHRQPITVQGGRTGLCGGAVANPGEFVLSLERMTGVSEVDVAGGTLTTWAGTPVQAVQEAAAAADLLFAVDFGARGSAQIGGAIATNAGGNRVIRYGMTRAQVLGLEVVLADGTVLSDMNRMLKNNAGYDVKQLFVGAEGTLGVITQAVLRLHPRPRSHCAALCALRSYDDVLAFLHHAQSSLGGMVSGFEVMWPDYYGLVARLLPNLSLPLPADGTLHVLIDLLGADQPSDDARFQTMLEEALEAGWLVDAAVSQSVADAESYWAVRDAVAELPLVWGTYEAFDVSIPMRDAGRFVTDFVAAVEADFPGAQCVNFGHVADSNLHMGVKLPDHRQAHALDARVYALVAAFAGSVSAEHGIGTHKKPYLKNARSDVAITLMQSLKQTLDPRNILNPGKVFDMNTPSTSH